MVLSEYLHFIATRFSYTSKPNGFFFTGSCQVNQICVSIKKCPHTQNLFSHVKSTTDPELKHILIEALRLLVCGKPSDRTVCCSTDQCKFELL